MFRHLLVPLDGSPLAEAAMPAARHLAKVLGAKVTLLHMIERHAPHTVHGQPHLAARQNAESYLADLAARTLQDVSAMQCHVHASEIDDVARSIIAHAVELQVDLIVLCTHGAGGVRHGLFGTVAERVIALGTTPVLLVPTPPPEGEQGFSSARLLVPLDGQPDHEQGLAAVANLAAAGSAKVLLLMVIPTWSHLEQSQQITARMLPATTTKLLDATGEPAQAYLESKMTLMKDAGYEVNARVVRGEPVGAIVAAAEEFQAGLIVLGTHGTRHLDAFWSGSVTPQLARKSNRSLLLVPVSESHG